MTEQPPSAVDVVNRIRENAGPDFLRPHLTTPEAVALIDALCEQRVSAETERAEAARLFLRALFVDLDADLKPLCRRLIEAYRAPAEHSAPEGTQPPTVDEIVPSDDGSGFPTQGHLDSSIPSALASTGEQPDCGARAIIQDCWGALNFILAFYEPGQRYLDTNAWKQAEASGRRAHAKAQAWLDADKEEDFGEGSV